MRYSENVVENTWLAFAFARPVAASEVDAGLRRVEDHYCALFAEAPQARIARGNASGLALWSRADERLRWPLWADGDGICLASSAVPTGWRRVVGDVAVDGAPAALARSVLAAPERIFELNPPFVLGARDARAGRMVLGADFLGAGRVYELRIDRGWAWSNRLGALPLFTGEIPQPDPDAWRIFAAAGWFLGETTPILGCTELAPGTLIEVSDEGGVTRVEHRVVECRRPLVEPRRMRFGEAVAQAADDVEGLAHDMGEAWSTEIAISLTGGRDSRVSAAGAVAAGIGATFNTGDQVLGEVDVVRSLVDAAPAAMPWEVHAPEPRDELEDDFLQRVREIHLVHDGMRNPQELRRPVEIPTTATPPPTLSGHGGELGHGFYYSDRAKLRRLRRGGDRGLADQLERNARRRHSAAHAAGYDAYLATCARTLELGRDYGLEGPTLLDWFYMAQRLPYRTGLSARSGRSSACTVPGFIRGCFDLTPRERLRARLHRAVVARLVPEWRRIDFFASGRAAMPEISRRRIWERPSEAATVSELIAAQGAWTEILRPERIAEMWGEVRAGGGSSDYEHVFARLVWREAFEGHLAQLRRRITQAPAADRPARSV